MSKKNLINIANPKKENVYPKGAEMNEANLVKAVKIFFDIKNNDEIITNKGLPSFKEHFEEFNIFRPDIALPKYGLVFEYDGYMHYQHPHDIERDRIKMLMLKKLKYKRIRWPYYFQMTEEVAKFVFRDLVNHFTGNKNNFYSDEKFYQVINQIYINQKTNKKLSPEDYKKGLLFAPGFHTTKHTPATFHEDGLKRFLDDMEWECKRKNKGCNCNGKTPEKLKHQVIKSLQLYIDDIGESIDQKKIRDYLVLPKGHKRFTKFYNSIKVNDSLCNVFYPRQKKLEY